MPNARVIGTWASGKRHLGAALEALRHHEFTAAQVWLTPPGKRQIIEVEDFEKMRFMALHEMQVYVHAPYVDALYPPLMRHDQAVKWLQRFGLEVERYGAGLVLHLGNKTDYLDTHIAAAAAILRVIPETVSVFVENDVRGRVGDLVRIIAQLRAVHERLFLCLDTAHAWSAGQPDLFEEDVLSIPRFVKQCGGVVGLLHLNNTTAAFGSESSSDHFPFFNGRIPMDQFATILRAFPQVPVILERNNHLQAVVDRAAVIAVDCNLPQTLEALRKSPINGALSS